MPLLAQDMRVGSEYIWRSPYDDNGTHLTLRFIYDNPHHRVPSCAWGTVIETIEWPAYARASEWVGNEYMFEPAYCEPTGTPLYDLIMEHTGG